MERDHDTVFIKPPSWETEFILEALAESNADTPEWVAALEVKQCSSNLAVGRMVSWRHGNPTPHGEPFILRRLHKPTLAALQWEGSSWTVFSPGEELPSEISPGELLQATRMRTALRFGDQKRPSNPEEEKLWMARCEKVAKAPSLVGVLGLLMAGLLLIGLCTWAALTRP